MNNLFQLAIRRYVVLFAAVIIFSNAQNIFSNPPSILPVSPNNSPSLISWRAPLTTPAPITSCFGPRKLLNRFKDFHHGVDFGSPRKTPVKAIHYGQVVWRGFVGCSGNIMVVEHEVEKDNWVLVVYRHLEKFKLKVGSRVWPGRVLALSGASGKKITITQKLATRGCVVGPHLHMEIHRPRPGVSHGEVVKILKKTRGKFAGSTAPVDPAEFVPVVRSTCSPASIPQA
jgi:murein DD-endopeptidase MepM/ murein hydrolase activator NlpD